MKLMSEIAREALELPDNQRLTLARLLLECSDIEEGSVDDATAAWENEISVRIQTIRSGTAVSRSSEEVFSDLDRLFPG